MMTEQVFKERLIGIINTCIRIINDSDKWDSVGKGIIENKWQSYVTKEDNTFVIILTILGDKQVFEFRHDEWYGFEVNLYANDKINALLKEYT